MKVYAILKSWRNRQDYKGAEKILCIKSTMELAQQFIDNYDFSDDEWKIKIIKKTKHKKSINFVVWRRLDEDYSDMDPEDYELEDIALIICEYEVEES